MRTAVSASALVIAALVAAGVAGACTGKDGATPRLKAVGTSPLVVQGTAFAPRGQVTVTVLTGLGPKTVRVRTSALGSFRVAFGKLTQPCGKPFAVRARTAAGKVVLLGLPAQPCVPPPLD